MPRQIDGATLDQVKQTTVYHDGGRPENTAGRHPTTLRPDTMSSHTTATTERSNPHTNHVNRTDMTDNTTRLQGKIYMTPESEHSIPRLMDVQIPGFFCHPPSGPCTRCGGEGYGHLRVPCPSRG